MGLHCAKAVNGDYFEFFGRAPLAARSPLASCTMAPRTRAATRFALLELNDDLLRSVLLLCGVDSLRALHRVSTRLRKLAHETLRLAKWRALPGNADELRDALWLAGQFTTRIVGASNSDSMSEAFIQDGRLIASNHSDEVSCFESKTGRFMFGMDVEVGKIAVQGDILAIGLMGLFPDSDSGVQIWAWQGEELSLIKELEPRASRAGLGWLGRSVLITHTANEDGSPSRCGRVPSGRRLTATPTR